MMQVLILESSFERELKEGKQEGFASILGYSFQQYIVNACVEAKLSIVTDKDDMQDDILVLSSSVPMINDQTLIHVIEDENDLYLGQQGSVVAYKAKKEELIDISWDMTFEASLEKLVHNQDRKVSSLSHLLVVENLVDLFLTQNKVAEEICYSWMRKGVRIEKPKETFISPYAKIGEGTWIQGSLLLEGKSEVGKNCLFIGACEVYDTKIGDGVVVKSSVLESSVMEDGSDIGPYSHLRPKSHVGKNVHLGNFVELKKASMGEGSKAGHLAYIGDAEVGKNVNISCGVIFCNYDGKKKHKTMVGDHAFIGSNVNLVAPLEVEEEAYIGAGSTITKKVEKGALAVERSEQKLILGYVDKQKRSEEK